MLIGNFALLRTNFGGRPFSRVIRLDNNRSLSCYVIRYLTNGLSESKLSFLFESLQISRSGSRNYFLKDCSLHSVPLSQFFQSKLYRVKAKCVSDLYFH